MKFMFVEAFYKGEVVLPKRVLDKLPKKIALFSTLQFIKSISKIKSEIEKTGRTVILKRGNHTKYKGQIYGCNLKKINVEAFLFIGDGLFHAKALYLGNQKPIHIWNPINKTYSMFDNTSAKKLLIKQKAGYAQFLAKNNIGVLISTKPGQSYLEYAITLKQKYPDKNFYYIVQDTIDFDNLGDFTFVDVWINTACPRIGWDDSNRTDKIMVDIGSII